MKVITTGIEDKYFEELKGHKITIRKAAALAVLIEAGMRLNNAVYAAILREIDTMRF